MIVYFVYGIVLCFMYCGSGMVCFSLVVVVLF